MLSAHIRARVPLVPTCELQVKAHDRNGGACVWAQAAEKGKEVEGKEDSGGRWGRRNGDRGAG